MNKLFDLTGRLALITGSSRGIGRAIAEGYLAAGARVVINGRDKDAVAAAVKALGSNAIAAPFDVTDKAAVEAAVDKIEKDIGPIDIVVNNAGMTKRMPFTEFPEADWRQIMATNLDSVFFVTQAVARDVLAYGGMLPADAAGYDLVLSIHDEILADVPETNLFTVEGLSAIMSTQLIWAAGLPLAAAGFEGKRYKK